MDVHVEKPVSASVLFPPQGLCLLLAKFGMGPRIQACWSWWEGESHLLIFKVKRGMPGGVPGPEGRRQGLVGTELVQNKTTIVCHVSAVTQSESMALPSKPEATVSIFGQA